MLKPNDEYGGKGVLLGWEATEAAWDDALQGALRDPQGSWIVQERIPVRARSFLSSTPRGASRCATCSWISRRTCFAAAIGGYLTRLSATGLANVTSGGGQVPPFVVS